MIHFNNTYSKLPDKFFERVSPASFSEPELILFNEKLADSLGIHYQNKSDKELASIFSGQQILEGSEPLAMAYAGFQFGHPVAQLGDGRAHYLGEVNGFDLQLKGSGQTRFSRRGDGRSALGPVLREYIVSEAMHVLGVPTTRALCAVSTGEEVYRQYGPEPGGVFTRVADSHIRVGTFQYFMFQQDLDGMKTLLDYTIKRHYPELKESKSKAIDILKALTHKQSDLIAKWSSFGFIHGVMNTDNFSLAGITIDYGPCAFMDEFRFHKVFSSIDERGRYSFFNQTTIAKWNILRLADCLLPLIDENQEMAIKKVEEEVINLFDLFEYKRVESLSKKLGLNHDENLVHMFLTYLEKESLDFTLAFRNLSKEDDSFFPKTNEYNEFINLWKSKAPDTTELLNINPLYIPRNHQIQRAIDMAYEGDYSHFKKMIQVLENPFSDQDEYREFSLAPKEGQKVRQTFCGT